MIRRREFIAGLGGAGAWPLNARVQQGEQLRRIGVLVNSRESDEQRQLLLGAFEQGLGKLGWIDGRNIRIDYRGGAADIDPLRTLASELVALRPDVLLANGSPVVAALRQATREIPIVFTTVIDPIGSGFVATLARPGGNVTGFMSTEPPLRSKWVELLKGIAPDLQRAAFLFGPDFAPIAGESVRQAEAAAVRLNVGLIATAVRNDSDVEDALAALARVPNSGLVVNNDAFSAAHRARIIALAMLHRLPAIYPSRFYATDGGLMSYGYDPIDQFRQAASYVDRILRGAKPADLPVQTPTRYEMVLNLKTARAIGLDVPPNLHALADEVIE
jgi:putative tryptophan/tyrosine transport system substrate-binding protein